MSTAVAIMDLDSWRARTDVIVVADSDRKDLRWVPRDLWCDSVGNRINTAFSQGGHELLHLGLAEHDLPVDASLVLRRAATEKALRSAAVTVPVERKLEFWYPLTPSSRLEEARKRIVFEPPEERLEGERLHQWIGARHNVNGSGWDWPRIERQQIFVRALLEQRFDFAAVLTDSELASSSPATATEELSRVKSDWTFSTLSDVSPARIRGREVMVSHSRRSTGWWLRERIMRRLRRWVR
jgi:anionic cell wall polymer biosynthesis LytR-Cps2A-Psr (LCP) family protein